MKGHPIIGIDEVGRGALAGPVVVAAAAVGRTRCTVCTNGSLRDSKKLSAKQRMAWFAHFKGHPGIVFAIAWVYPRGIEKMNISRAANLAAYRAYHRLVAKQRGLSISPIFLDGGLYLMDHGTQAGRYPRARTVVKADEKVPAVAIASIVAKVSRDASLCRLEKQYPEYSFRVHKGYGTKAHYAALKKHGASPVHRLTFLKKEHIIHRNGSKP